MAWWESSDKDASWDTAAAAADGGAAAGGDAWKESEWKQDASATQEADASWGQAAAAAPAADPWSKEASDPWQENAGQTEQGGQEKWDTGYQEEAKTYEPPPAREFWDTQNANEEAGTYGRKEEWEQERDDTALFAERLGDNAGINFAAYANVPVEISGDKADRIPVCKSFEELYQTFQEVLPQTLMDNIRRCRYDTPTPVQKYAIPAGLVGRDIMCCAQTGSGKTAAFLVPLVGRMIRQNHLGVSARQEVFKGACKPFSLVMTPTRELCVQIYEEALKFSHRTDFRVCRVYGGEQVKIQLNQIAYGADIVVACPGRLNDFIGRGVIDVTGVNVLVLDEADRMLDMGFEPQIREIVEQHGMPTKDKRQTLMFSATFPDSCQKMAQDYLYEYIWIGVGIVGGAVDTVDQQLLEVPSTQKFSKLLEVLDNFELTKERGARVLVFCNSKDTCRWMDEQLYEKKYNTGCLHGDLDQSQRETNLGRFRRGEIEVMIATDVAARGLDIENVTLVVNLDLPQEIDAYIHRIGRTGRIGNQGTAITFIAVDEKGECLENVTNLRSLVNVMQNAKIAVPDWLESFIENNGSGGGGGWKWGGQDYRTDQETYRGSGGGDTWGDWKKDEEQTENSSWEQKSSW